MEQHAKSRMSRRAAVRLLSYAAAALVVLAGFVTAGYTLAAKYSTQLGYTYEHGLTELSEHLNNIETTLTKGIYTGTSAGASNLAMTLWSEAGAAKSCLASVPTTGTNLDNTYKFLSQVGEYSLSLAKKMTRGEPITEDEKNQLLSLADYSKQINQAVSELCLEMNEGGQWANHIKSTIQNHDPEEAANTLYSGFKDLEQNLTDFPTLLYDGPFSDHILQSKPLFLEGKAEVSAEQAKEVAASASGVDIAALSQGSDENGIMPSYNFFYDNTNIAVTKAGGYCSYLLNARETGDTVLGYDECLEKAKAYLNSLSLGDFKESYYAVSEGVCIINFAYSKDNIIYYTDLIKVGVALDNGEIVSYNAQGYIMNHTDRNFKTPKHTLSEAEAVLSDLLTVESRNTAIIPLDTREERLCYEFVCKGRNDDEIIVYVNADTLEEEKLMILLKSDGGVLTI